MSLSAADVVTHEQLPLVVGDKVSWRTGTGFRTGGVITALLDEKTARVQTNVTRNDSVFGRVNIARAKLTKENPL